MGRAGTPDCVVALHALILPSTMRRLAVVDLARGADQRVLRPARRSTMNQGSTAMQWPPTPGPGCRMLTRGWRLASRITSQTSMPSLVADDRQLVGEGDVDVAEGVLGQLAHLRRARVGDEQLARARRCGRAAARVRAQRGVMPPIDAVVVDQFDQDAARQHALGAIGDVDVGESSPSVSRECEVGPQLGQLIAPSARWCRPARSIPG